MQASLATGLLIWGFIAMMGNGELAPYLLGASALLYAIQAALWIIYHPIRALVGFLLLGGRRGHAEFHASGKVDREHNLFRRWLRADRRRCDLSLLLRPLAGRHPGKLPLKKANFVDEC